MKTHTESVFVKTGVRYERIDIDDILYIEGMKDYLMIHCKSKRIMILATFKEIEPRLDASKFIRIHKSYIVSLEHLDRLEYNQVYIGDKKMPVGQSFRKFLLKEIEVRGF